MRFSKALWFAAVAALISTASTAFAQTTAGQGGSAAAPAKPGTKPTDKPATAPATDKSGTATGGATKPAAGTEKTPAAGETKPGTATGTTGTGTGATKTTTGAAGTTTTGTTGTAGASTTAGPSATSSGTSATGATATGGMDGATYVVRLRDLEQRIDELKEQIRRSHTRLSLLSDTILSGGVGGARTELVFKNELSNAFRLSGAVFVLDGAVQYNEQDESETSPLATQKEIPIFSGSVPPGDHTLQVVLRLRGHGYGVFSYLRGYKFELKSSHSFTITEGKTLRLDVVAWEKGDLTTPLEQRPAVRYTENLKAGIAGGSEKPGKAPAKGGASGGVSIGAGAK